MSEKNRQKPRLWFYNNTRTNLESPHGVERDILSEKTCGNRRSKIKTNGKFTVQSTKKYPNTQNQYPKSSKCDTLKIREIKHITSTEGPTTNTTEINTFRSYSDNVKPRRKNIVFFSDSILKYLNMK